MSYLFFFQIERKLCELLKRVQNRQYDDQRGTSLTAFKEMPDFLRVDKQQTSDSPDEEALSTKFSDDKEIDGFLQQSNVEVCRHPSDCSSTEHDCLLEPSIAFINNELDSILPTVEHAEQYFSQSIRVSSPDFNNTRHLNGPFGAGLHSPDDDDDNGWTLIGNISTSLSGGNSTMTSPRDDLNVCLTDVYPDDDCCDQDKHCSTPSPRTHDLLFVDGECFVAKTFPFVDDDNVVCSDQQDCEDDGQILGVV